MIVFFFKSVLLSVEGINVNSRLDQLVTALSALPPTVKEEIFYPSGSLIHDCMYNGKKCPLK